MTGDKTFTLHWLDGKKEVVAGSSISDAITRAGYGHGAMRALDFWSVGINDIWHWNPPTGWERGTIEQKVGK